MYDSFCRCQVCPYKARSSSQLQVHLRIHTGDTPYQCKKCGHYFKVKSDLKRHMRTHTGEKPYSCPEPDCAYRCSIRSMKLLFLVFYTLTFSQKSPGFYVTAENLEETLWEKEKLLVTSNFSFSHSVSYPIGELFAIYMKFTIVVCKLFQFGRV